MKKELIKLANHLDKLGRKTEADYLGVLVGVMSKTAQEDELEAGPLSIGGFDQDVELVAQWIGQLQNSGHLNVDPTLGETIRNISMEIVRALAQDQQSKDVGYGHITNPFKE